LIAGSACEKGTFWFSTTIMPPTVTPPLVMPRLDLGISRRHFHSRIPVRLSRPQACIAVPNATHPPPVTPYKPYKISSTDGSVSYKTTCLSAYRPWPRSRWIEDRRRPRCPTGTVLGALLGFRRVLSYEYELKANDALGSRESFASFNYSHVHGEHKCTFTRLM
jgi:hypothetical protein